MTSGSEGNSVDPPLFIQQTSGPPRLPSPADDSHSVDPPQVIPPLNLTPNSHTVEPLSERLDRAPLGPECEKPLSPHLLFERPLQDNDISKSSPVHSDGQATHTNGDNVSVVESSRRETSRASFQTLTYGDQSSEVRSVVQKSTDSHTRRVSVAEAPPAAPVGDSSRYDRAEDLPGGQTFNSHSIMKKTRDTRVTVDGKQTTSTSVSLSVDQSITVSSSSNAPYQYLSSGDPISQKYKPEDFSFEKSDVARRLKPQLTSSFMSQELGSTVPQTPQEIDDILRKYGIETRKYIPPPVTLSRYAGAGSESYRPYPPSRSSTTLLPNCSMSSNTVIPTPRQMDVSQNNEALSKLVQSKADAQALSNASADTTVAAAVSDTTETKDHTDTTDEPPVLSQVNTKPVDDVSKNNDTQGEEASAVTAADLQAHQGSSVDINAARNPQPQAASYPPLSGLTNTMSYKSGYSAMRMRTGGYSMATQPSVMDVSPFEGTYLKNHLASTRYSSSTRLGNGLSETSTGPTDVLPSYGIRNTTTATDRLGYSLMQERQRLRHIDDLITSGPARASRPYMSIHSPASGMSSYWSSNAPTTAVTATSSSTNNAPAVPTYDNPSDIARIRHGGSNVDTGQFNNNRGGNNSTLSSKFEKRVVDTRQQQPNGKNTAKKVSCGATRGAPVAKTPQSRFTGSQRRSTSSNRKPNVARHEKDTTSCAQTKGGLCTRTGDTALQRNNSYNPVASGLEFARELNRLWRHTMYDREPVLSKYGSIPTGGRDECCQTCSIEEKTSEEIDTPVETCTPRQASAKKKMSKYQPYTARVKKQQRPEGQNGGEGQPLGPRYAWQDVTTERERDIIAATALASGLIERRQIEHRRMLHGNALTQQQQPVVGRRKTGRASAGRSGKASPIRGAKLVVRPRSARAI